MHSGSYPHGRTEQSQDRKLWRQWATKVVLANLRAITRSQPRAGLEREVVVPTRLGFGEGRSAAVKNCHRKPWRPPG